METVFSIFIWFLVLLLYFAFCGNQLFEFYWDSTDWLSIYILYIYIYTIYIYIYIYIYILIFISFPAHDEVLTGFEDNFIALKGKILSLDA